MSGLRDIPRCPYVGLQPYSARDREYFFGREREQRLIASNLRAARLTVLYGSTGVGKSSVLMAGVVPRLQSARHTAVVFFNAWRPGFHDALKARCAEAAEAALGRPASIDTARPLDHVLSAVAQAARGSVLLLLDQFEEYFTYHAGDATDTEFEAELARAINGQDLDAGFLVALREDALARLDRFRERIPSILANPFRLGHLDLHAAERAIRGPLETYSRVTGEAVGIEDALVQEVLQEVRAGRQRLGDGAAAATTGRGLAGDEAEPQIETPFLQLVMERLWYREREQGSPQLRLTTFRELGGAARVVGRHLDDVVQRLSDPQQEVCSQFFDRLVTPSGTKIAYPEDDLRELAGPRAAHVAGALQTLVDARILRTVPLGGRRGVEIFHDVLAPSVLAWRERYLRARDRRREQRRLRRRIAQGVAVALVALALLGSRTYVLWRANRPWGTLGDLTTGTEHWLAGRQITVGRNVKGYVRNVIDLQPSIISRVHLLVTNDPLAIDLRSFNGTTVNAEILEYGTSAPLKSGDLVVLGGIAPFRFDKVEYASWQLWTPSARHLPPARGWGMLIDGRGRRVLPLERDEHFLIAGDRGLEVRDEAGPGAVARIQLVREAAVVENPGPHDMIVRWKRDDHNYRERIVAPGYRVSSIPMFDEEALIYSATFAVGDYPFQVVKVVTDLERSAARPRLRAEADR